MLYAAVTQYLGFEMLSDEYKVMGLALYGGDSLVPDFRRLVNLSSNGFYSLNLDFFQFHETFGKTSYVSEKFYKLFGPPRKNRDPVDKRHQEIASSLQSLMKDTAIHLITHLKRVTQERELCYSGGELL